MSNSPKGPIKKQKKNVHIKKQKNAKNICLHQD